MKKANLDIDRKKCKPKQQKKKLSKYFPWHPPPLISVSWHHLLSTTISTPISTSVSFPSPSKNGVPNTHLHLLHYLYHRLHHLHHHLHPQTRSYIQLFTIWPAKAAVFSCTYVTSIPSPFGNVSYFPREKSTNLQAETGAQIWKWDLENSANCKLLAFAGIIFCLLPRYNGTAQV